MGGPAGERSGAVRARLLPRRLLAPASLLFLSACAATQNAAATAPEAPGFLLGVWHGFIFPIAWIVSLFVDSVSVYAVPNNGGWYDFGYFVGIVFLGVGARKTRTVTRERVIVRDRGGARPVEGSHTIRRDEDE